MKLKFYYFFNSLWMKVSPSCKSCNNKRREEIISDYLKDCSLVFTNTVIQNLKYNNYEVIDIGTESWGLNY